MTHCSIYFLTIRMPIDVIPAKAGIHFDLALRLDRLHANIKIKMDPSFRWDDDPNVFSYPDSIILA